MKPVNLKLPKLANRKGGERTSAAKYLLMNVNYRCFWDLKPSEVFFFLNLVPGWSMCVYVCE